MVRGRFWIDIDWDEKEAQGTAFSATAGTAGLYLGSSRSIWDIHWTWIDLLAFLGENWIALLTESVPSSFPQAQSPHLLRREAEREWGELKRVKAITEDQYLSQEAELFCFEERHDLSRAIQGKFVPDLFIVREGPEFLVSSSAGETAYLPYDEVVSSLEEIGNRIAARLEGLADPVAVARCGEWRQRWPEINLDLVSLSTGASQSYLKEISDDADPVKFWGENNKVFRDNMPMALARMGNGAQLSARSVRTVLTLVNSSHAPKSNRLKEISRDASSFLGKAKEQEPADEGRALASWYRTEILRVGPRGKVDPCAPIRDLAVEIHEIRLQEEDVDAISCWRPEMQPVVVLNNNSSRNRKVSGQRAALAHELCHLIADCDGAIPFAEVMKGNGPGRLEKRARGFAAEFLAPRRAIAEEFRDSENIPAFVDRMAAWFDVSSEIIAWQIWRSGLVGDLLPEDLASLKRFVSHPTNMG